MSTWNFLIFPFFFLLVRGETVLDTTCDNGWESYKNKKCLRVFDTKMQSYDEAKNYCLAKHGANLVSIGFEDKQKFVENYLQSNGILNEVWIGLKYDGTKYIWSDDTAFYYSNWGIGSPKYDPSHCVQLDTDESELGKWGDVLCTKKNVVLCEKAQPWSFAMIQNEIQNIKQNLVPIGFMYVQLPGEKKPSEIWSGMTWADISAAYAGVFFRVVGGKSSPFGTVQQPSSPRINYIEASEDSNFRYEGSINITADNQLSKSIHAASFNIRGFNTFRGLAFRQTNDEVRPLNMAMRIWKRIQ